MSQRSLDSLQIAFQDHLKHLDDQLDWANENRPINDIKALEAKIELFREILEIIEKA